jgi:hypothetical protein
MKKLFKIQSYLFITLFILKVCNVPFINKLSTSLLLGIYWLPWAFIVLIVVSALMVKNSSRYKRLKKDLK